MKKLLVCLIFFALGFGTHSWLAVEKVQPMSVDNILSKKVLGEQTDTTDFITQVEFDGEKFSPNSVKVIVGNYLAITNSSLKNLMTLKSDNQMLETLRGYGEGEQLMVLMPQKGVYRVVEVNHPKDTLVVSVE